MTIFAARRVLPPDFMTPANASKPFMKDTGPLALPPVERCSLDERRLERLDPVPEPYLNSKPSVTASCIMERMSSWTELMKQAEHWGFSSTPTLNQTGLLNAASWLRSMCVSSASKVAASSSSRKYLPCRPHLAIVPATRPMSCLALVSRSVVPSRPLKYFEATMLVAVWDQNEGTSTFFCSKMTCPL